MAFDPMKHVTHHLDDEAVTRIAEAAMHASSRDRGEPVAIEVGAWAGATTRILADMGFKVFVVDHWKGSPTDRVRIVVDQIGGQRKAAATFMKNMEGMLMRNVIPLFGESTFWGSVWPDDYPADLIYLDAGHGYHDIRDDIKVWTPHVAKGGILAGHDFGVGFPGVDRAVKETGQYERDGQAVWWRKL